MSPVDRTDELIAAMLARRAGQPMPDALLDRTVAAIAAERQVRGGRTRGVPGPIAVGGRTAVAAAGVLLLIGLTVGAMATGLLVGDGSAEPSPAVVAGPTAAPASSPTPPPSDSPSATPTPAPASPTTAPAFPPDTLAVVTRSGNRLRVFTAPTNGEGSEKLWPLLRSGERLLVLGGPVAADGYDWYEVMVEDQPDAMHGWVAAARGATRWIRQAAPDCRGDPGRLDVADMRPFDFLLCYHGREVTLKARMSEGQTGADVACPWLGDTACEVAEGWLLGSTYVTFKPSEGRRRTIGLSVPPAVQPSLEAVPDGATMTLTIAMDAPEARACRITDPATGEDLVPPNRVITVCRLAFVLRAVEWSP